MQSELSVSKSQNAPPLDEATLGPLRYLLASMKQALGGIGALFKNPKLLLPTIIISIMWLALSYLKLYMPASGAVFALSLIFFAQGGMYAGLLGAIGGIIGKAFFAWFATNALMPLLTGKKAPKSVKMKIGPAFAIRDMRGFALFVAGSGMALIIYNFLTGNASLENSVIGLTAMVACLRALRNPGGFLVGFLRSFSKGRLTRPRAGHCVLGMMLGFALGIGSSLLTSGGLCYTMGSILLAISIVVAVVFRGRRIPAAAMIVMLLMGVMAPTLQVAEAEPKWMDPYEAYGVAKGDYEALKAAIAKKPFYGAKVEPMGMSFGTYYGIVPNGQEIIIEGGKETTIDLDISSPSLEDLHNKTDDYSYLSSKFKGRVSFFYDEGALGAESPYDSSFSQNRLPIMARSVGDYSGYVINRSDYESGVAASNFYIKGSESSYPVVFDSFEHIRESLLTDTEYSVYGQQAFSYDPGQLFMVAKLAGGTQITWSDGEVSDEGIDSVIHLCVKEIMLDAPSGATEKVSTVWVLDDVIIDNPNEGDSYFHTEVANGRIFESSGGEEGSQYNATEYTWTPPPERIELGRENEIQVKKRITWQGDNFTAQAGYMLGRAYISAMLDGESEMNIVYEGFFAAEGQEGTSTTLYGNNLDPGQSVEGIYTVKQNKSRTGETPYDKLTSENSRLFIEISAFGSGSVTYMYKLSTEAVYGKTGPGGVDDEGLLEGILDPWEHEWDERADEVETGVIGAASALAGLVGAGAAAAGGFGGPYGPGGFFRIKREGMDYDPSDGTLVVTSPSGSQELYRLNPATGKFESSYGSELDLDDVERAHNEHRISLANSAQDRKRMENRTDGQSEYLRKLDRIQHLKDRLQREAGGDGDSLASQMAERLERIQGDISSGKGLDEKAYRAARDAYGRYTRGEIAGSGSIPGEYTDWEHAKDTIAMSSEEISRGESGKAIALRVLAGMLTAGKSEIGFEAARSVYTTKDYVDAGGDSWREAVSNSVMQTVVDEGIGRAAGLGIDIAGKAGSYATKMASKTRIGKAAIEGASNLAGKASDFFGQNVDDLAKKMLGKTANTADDAAKALKKANAASAIKAANKQLDDAVKAASNQADDMAKVAANTADDAVKSATKQLDDAAKAAGGKADDAAKAATKNADDAAKAADKADDAVKNAGEKTDDASKAAEKADDSAKAEGPNPEDYKAAEKKWNKQMDKAKDEAKKEIDKYKQAASGKDSAESARDALYRKGQKIGEQKVDNLRRAQERLNSNPGSREAQDAYDQALRSVQQDKYAMTKLNSLDGPGANELRGNFNMRNEQFTQSALRNTKERLALEHGVDPSEIKFVEATNSGAGARTADASVTAKKVDVSQHTAADFKGASTVDDVIPQSARIKGAPMDKDVTARIFDKKTNQWIDIPKDDVERVYRQELYKSHHKGELPKLDGKDIVDEKEISKFAEKMDHTVTDRTGKDAYGRGDKDLVNILDKGNKGVKEFEDITSVTGTMEYKSNEWFERADKLREDAQKLGGSSEAAEELLMEAEALQGEGVRQLVKQFDAQVAGQVKAVAAAGKNIQVSDKLLKSIRVLDQVGKEGGITMAQAEGILKGMGTSVDDVVQQSSSIMEAIAKFKR